MPYEGISELTGDERKIAIDFSGDPQPKDFGIAPGDYTYSFRREKDSK